MRDRSSCPFAFGGDLNGAEQLRAGELLRSVTASKQSSVGDWR
jgi:hypothetical protein